MISSKFPSQLEFDEENLLWGTPRGVLFMKLESLCNFGKYTRMTSKLREKPVTHNVIGCIGGIPGKSMLFAQRFYICTNSLLRIVSFFSDVLLGCIRKCYLKMLRLLNGRKGSRLVEHDGLSRCSVEGLVMMMSL